MSNKNNITFTVCTYAPSSGHQEESEVTSPSPSSQLRKFHYNKKPTDDTVSGYIGK